ncbi:hypothetical protein [Nostoc sp.]|uniref:hypothetical protein n=1 Tax=Nostoc sp. TaxID=1180 RepID=UPI002FF6ED29
MPLPKRVYIPDWNYLTGSEFNFYQIRGDRHFNLYNRPKVIDTQRSRHSQLVLQHIDSVKIIDTERSLSYNWDDSECHTA